LRSHIKRSELTLNAVCSPGHAFGEPFDLSRMNPAARPVSCSENAQ